MHHEAIAMDYCLHERTAERFILNYILDLNGPFLIHQLSVEEEAGMHDVISGLGIHSY